MKTLILNIVAFSCVVVCGVTVTTAGEKINFIDNDWSKARLESKEKGKHLFMDAYTDWCGWCKEMDRTTFSNGEVARFMTENFVSLKMEMEREYGIKLAAKFHTTSFPQFLIFSSDGKLVHRITGYLKPTEFLVELKKALEPAEQNSYKGISAEVELAFPEFYANEFGGKKKRQRADSSTVERYVAEQQNLLSEVNYRVLTHYISRLSARTRDAFFSRKADYAALYGAEDMDDAINNYAWSFFMKARSEKKEALLDSTEAIMKRYKVPNVEDNMIVARLQFQKEIENWSTMAGLITKVDMHSPNFSNLINECAWAVYEKCNDSQIIDKATSWMKELCSKKDDYAMLDTYASLLHKSGKNNDALSVARRAIESGKKSGADVKGTEELIKKINGAGK